MTAGSGRINSVERAGDASRLRSRRITRRSLVGIGVGAAFTVVVSSPVRALAQEVATSGTIVRTTAAVDLRSGPGTSYSVLLVIPAGTGLESSLTITDGFQNVSYNGTSGWVSREFLVDVVADPATSRPDGETQYTGRARVEAAVNFRAGASTSAPIDLTMAAGTVVETSGVLRNGFRACRLNSQVGWVIDGALVPAAGGGGSTPPAGGQTGYTTTDVNFRMEPAYGDNVIRVLLANTVVTITGEVSGDFIRVATSGDIGWVFGGYVSVGAPGGGNPGGGGGATTGTVTTGLNLRASASTAAQILTVMPAGATVTITGAVSNGFLPVTYGGLSGWAASDYIQTGDGAPGTPHGSFRTTAALNLRQGPSVSTPILLVVPAGATVASGGVAASGYTAVSFGGSSGYLLSEFLIPA